MNRERSVKRLASEYIGTNCFVGVSPFDPRQLAFDQLVGKSADQQALPGFHLGAGAAMFGLDYPPDFESIVPNTRDMVATFAADASVTADDVRNIVFDNAANLYGFDREALQPHVERIGFDIGELVAAG